MKNVKSHWSPEHYESRFSFVYDYGEDLIALLNPLPNERILDLGSGTGQLTDLIGKSAGEVIGMDNSAEMVGHASTQYPYLKFFQKDAADFSFEKPFDAIFSNATLHWVLDQLSCIKCLAGNLKPDGRLVVEFGGYGNIQKILSALRKALSLHGFDKQAALKLWNFPTIGEYTSALERQGFGVISAWHFDRPTVLSGDLIEWFDMFANPFFEGIVTAEAEVIKKEAQEMARSDCFSNGKWIADYSRIRILAKKVI